MAKPADLPEWNSDETNNVEPNAGRKATGFTTGGDVPGSGELNWWMNNVFDWATWLDTYTAANAKLINDGSGNWSVASGGFGIVSIARADGNTTLLVTLSASVTTMVLQATVEYDSPTYVCAKQLSPTTFKLYPYLLGGAVGLTSDSDLSFFVTVTQ